MDKFRYGSRAAFTLVEIAVVITVIAILATIVFFSYNSLMGNAIRTSLVSDLVEATNQIKLYQNDNGKLPTSLGCPTVVETGTLCIKSTNGNEFLEYNANNTTSPKTFQLSARNGDKFQYRTASNASSPLPCPAGFVIVPGSSTYKTSDFCVMKYEAKKGAGDIAESVWWGTPWSSMTQDQAMDYSKKVANCDSCHLISEAEWLTIMQNVLLVKNNWSSGEVGNGYIYSGHSDEAYDDPNRNPLPASLDDSDGYAGTGNDASDIVVRNGMIGKSQRRTLYLSNGEVIWDLAGNMWERTSGHMQAGDTKPGITGYTNGSWADWKDVTQQASWSPNPSLASTEIPAASNWTMANGVGVLQSDISDSSIASFVRGGDNVFNYKDSVLAGQGGSGVSALTLYRSPENNGWHTFRVAR